MRGMLLKEDNLVTSREISSEDLRHNTVIRVNNILLYCTLLRD